jgi:hypothetical protein
VPGYYRAVPPGQIFLAIVPKIVLELVLVLEFFGGCGQVVKSK